MMDVRMMTTRRTPLAHSETLTADDDATHRRFSAGSRQRLPNIPDRTRFYPEQARYAAEIYQLVRPTEAERALLAQNSFFATDRLLFETFCSAYATIAEHELPVLITTDSLLHALHHATNALQVRIETRLLAPQLAQLLHQVRTQLRRTASSNTNPDLTSLYYDLDIYLSVPLALLAADPTNADISEEAAHYVALIQRGTTKESLILFGGQRHIDTQRFRPCGHYTHNPRLARYFRAIMWLSQIDMRLVDYDEYGCPRVQVRHIAAAALLADAILESRQRAAWNAFERLFSALFSRRSCLSLLSLEHFLRQAGITCPADLLADPNSTTAVATLTERTICDQVTRSLHTYANQHHMPTPLRFALVGQQPTPDTLLLNRLGAYRRATDSPPGPFDLLYAFGSDRAGAHLAATQPTTYRHSCDRLRAELAQYPPGFWTENAYHQRLQLLRTLGQPTNHHSYPQAMQTTAWHDKMLQTQLVAWAQMRHSSACPARPFSPHRLRHTSPTGFVEPYPSFYQALADYAHMGLEIIADINCASIAQAETTLERLEKPGTTDLHSMPIFQESISTMRQQALAYFEHLEMVATMLRNIAEKQLHHKPLNDLEHTFLCQTITATVPCEHDETSHTWDGWYPRLFPWDASDNPAFVADLGNGVQVASSAVATMLFMVEDDSHATMYIGPSFIYSEYPHPVDESTRHEPPAWVHTFRAPATSNQRIMAIATRDIDVDKDRYRHVDRLLMQERWDAVLAMTLAIAHDDTRDQTLRILAITLMRQGAWERLIDMATTVKHLPHAAILLDTLAEMLVCGMRHGTIATTELLPIAHKLAQTSDITRALEVISIIPDPTERATSLITLILQSAHSPQREQITSALSLASSLLRQESDEVLRAIGLALAHDGYLDGAYVVVREIRAISQRAAALSAIAVAFLSSEQWRESIPCTYTATLEDIALALAIQGQRHEAVMLANAILNERSRAYILKYICSLVSSAV